MDELNCIEIKALVPSRDFALSKRFYAALGFELEWSTPEMAGFRLGASRFLLQNFYVREHARNFVMSLYVSDVEAWWAHASSVVSEFGMALEPVADRAWGMRDFPLIDPSGVLWRIGTPVSHR